MRQAINEPDWEFRIAGERCFVIVFAECYPITSSRFSFGTLGAFIFIQPQFSFENLKLPRGESLPTRETIRCKYALAGRPYSIGPIMHSELEAPRYVKPLHEATDPVVKWWVENFKSTIERDPNPLATTAEDQNVSIEVGQCLSVLSWAGQLREVLRHCWPGRSGRQESVAEHSWRLQLMAICLNGYLKEPVELGRVLQMLAVHDLAEIEAGDDHAIAKEESPALKRSSVARESEAWNRLEQRLPVTLGKHLKELWLEFEKQESREAKFAYALDKLEAQLSHNESDLATWTDQEVQRVFSGRLEQLVHDEPALLTFCKRLTSDAKELIATAGRTPIP